MTLKQWLKLQRLPEYCGINARQYLRTLHADKPFYFKALHTSINIRDLEVKAIVFQAAIASKGVKK